MQEELSEIQKKELKRLADEITEESKLLVKDYDDNPSDMSGSAVLVHQNSPYLKIEQEDDGEY
tara:strand:+ start:1352 stop:1540 length:189 start_codon:yes stop_codon:yes gene_type:complete